MCLQGNKTDQLSIVEIIEKSECFLKSKGVSSPKSDAEWIVSHILGKPKLELYLSYDEKMKGKRPIYWKNVFQYFARN